MAYSSESSIWTHGLNYNSYLQRGGTGVYTDLHWLIPLRCQTQVQHAVYYTNVMVTQVVIPYTHHYIL